MLTSVTDTFLLPSGHGVVAAAFFGFSSILEYPFCALDFSLRFCEEEEREVESSLAVSTGDFR